MLDTEPGTRRGPLPLLAFVTSSMALFWWLAVVGGSTTLYLNGSGGVGVSANQSASDAFATLVEDMVIGLIGLLAVGFLFAASISGRGHADTQPLPMQGPTRERFLCAAGLYAAATLSSHFAFNLRATLGNDSGTAEMTPAEWIHTVRALLAGFTEEPFFAVVPVLMITVFARRLPVRWRSALVIGVFVLSASLRAGIHLYQGPSSSVTAFVWGLAAVYAFWCYRSAAALVALIVVHALWNSTAILGRLDAAFAYYAVEAVLIGLAAAFVFYVTRPRSVGLRSGPIRETGR